MHTMGTSLAEAVEDESMSEGIRICIFPDIAFILTGFVKY